MKKLILEILSGIAAGMNAAFTNQFMSHSGGRYNFKNDVRLSNGDDYSVSFDMGSGEFMLKTFNRDTADTFNILYNKSRNSVKAFKALVNVFGADTIMADVERLLKDNGVRIKHSWHFNPYYD